MFTNITSAETFEDLIGKQGVNMINRIIYAGSVLAFIYGVTSWCLIKQFRNFSNYVVLSAITAHMLMTIAFESSFIVTILEIDLEYPVALAFGVSAILFGILSFNNWLSVLYYIFDMDFVKVFQFSVTRRYLKSSMFTWGLIFIVSFVHFIIVWIFHSYLISAPADALMINFVIVTLIPVSLCFVVYLKVLYSLFRTNNVATSSSVNKWYRSYIATLIMLILTLNSFKVNNLICSLVAELGMYTITIAYYLYCNREEQSYTVAKISEQ